MLHQWLKRDQLVQIALGLTVRVGTLHHKECDPFGTHRIAGEFDDEGTHLVFGRGDVDDVCTARQTTPHQVGTIHHLQRTDLGGIDRTLPPPVSDFPTPRRLRALPALPLAFHPTPPHGFLVRLTHSFPPR